MKVTTKLFIVALILSLMLTVGAAAAAEDISFEKSDTKIIKKDTNENLLSSDDREYNLKTSEENRLTQSSDKIVSAQNNQNTLINHYLGKFFQLN